MTRLAVEYAWRYASAYDLVWWIRAEDPATMRGDYAELARTLGLVSETDDQAIAALRRELRQRRGWLLVFDNAEDPGELFSLLPDRHPGHVLITSRRREWPYAETRHLEVLSAEAGAGYLQRRGQVADADTARALAEALGCLPLALAQAASVIAKGMAAADYLALLHQQSPELFTEGHPADHEMTVGSTWRVSVDRLAERSPAAVARLPSSSAQMTSRPSPPWPTRRPSWKAPAISRGRSPWSNRCLRPGLGSWATTIPTP